MLASWLGQERLSTGSCYRTGAGQEGTVVRLLSGTIAPLISWSTLLGTKERPNIS